MKLINPSFEIIQQERQKNQKELEKKLKQKEADNNKESRDDPATNEESKPNKNLKDFSTPSHELTWAIEL